MIRSANRDRHTLSALFLAIVMACPGLLADEASLQDAEGRWHGQKPNILWILIEDWSTDLSCYGTPLVHTPNIDKLASQGIRFQWA